MVYQEPAKLCSCNDDKARLDIQSIDAVKVVALLHYRMFHGKHIIQIDPPRALQNTGLFRRHSQHARIYISPMPVKTDGYGATVVRIQESVLDDNLRLNNKKVK